MSRLELSWITTVDIRHIEYITDREVLNYLHGGFRWLKRNVREDVILYFEAFANMLECKLTASFKVNFDELMN